VFRSPNFAWYIAASARAMTDDNVSPATTMVAPMLNVAWIVVPDS
jgi:hypothetical protein